MPGDERSGPHFELVREEPITRRRPRPVPVTPEPPENPRGHAATLQDRLRAARDATSTDLGGYDARRLLKITLTQKVRPEDIERAAEGIEVVSHEDDTVILAFATTGQLDTFEAKLSNMAAGEHVTYRNLLYALGGFDRWRPEDRTGWALERHGFPNTQTFVVDAELWPAARDRDATRLRTAFETWVESHSGDILDSAKQPYLTVYRIRCDDSLAQELLNHRDVRTVDLPPRVGIDWALIYTPVQDLDDVPDPPTDAPGVVVLDSGLATGHPVIAPAVGDARSFLPGVPPSDEHGHGTIVSGVALYDDVAECLRNRSFIPELRIFSGRILDHNNRGDAHLIENQVERAVRYFVTEYDCRIFNLSYGDLNKPYRNRHVAGLAVTLDALSRELDVLFVVPTGNFTGGDDGPDDWLQEYPDYLTEDTSVLLDPAPALSALTVGSLARNELHPRYPDDPAYRPIARSDQPSPFTRHGPSVNGAIKPDLVDYGGNWMIDTRVSGSQPSQHGTGEISTSHQFAAGRPFALDSGTSFAAPRVAHAVGNVLRYYLDASVDRFRALLVAHARTPSACSRLFGNDQHARNVTGYGRVDRSALYQSDESCVTLWVEETIENQQHQFFEIPIPEEFWLGGRRVRELTVALAYRPVVRTTRLEYRAAAISFRLVQAPSLDEVAERFDAATDTEDSKTIPDRQAGRSVSARDRSRGTVQAATWSFTQPSKAVRESSWFIVVTRNDPAWGMNLSDERESYALVVTLADRLVQQPRLYTHIEARLRERARARARV